MDRHGGPVNETSPGGRWPAGPRCVISAAMDTNPAGAATPAHPLLDLIVAAAFLQRLTSVQAPRTLTRAQARLLSSLEASGEVRMSELATLEGVTRPAITKLIARLEADALVRRRTDASDGRAALVAITAEGRRALQRRRRELGKALPPLDDRETDTITRAVEILRAKTAIARTNLLDGDRRGA